MLGEDKNKYRSILVVIYKHRQA